MAGEYQVAQRLIQEGMAEAAAAPGMDRGTLARAFMYQLLEHNKNTREVKDIISELEQHVMSLLDDGDHVITRGS